MKRLALVTSVWLSAFLLTAAAASASYTFETAWGQPGSSDGQFNNPLFVATGPDGSVYISDNGNNRVQKFTADGAFQSSLTGAGSPGGTFVGPTGVAVGPDGSVYVADSGNNRVVRFDAAGNFLSQWGTPGSGDGQFQGPAGIGVGPDGSVYVGDSGNARVQRFLSDGTSVGLSITSQAGGFGQVSGVAVGDDGTVYVVDNVNSRVEHFDANGGPLGTWGSPGSGDGQFLNARGIAASPAGVYVADATQNRIEKFTTTGAFVDSLDASSGDTALSAPAGVAVSNAGQIYVVGNNRASRYSESGGANLQPPQTGTSANVQPVDGTVKIKTPGSNQFIVLSDGQHIPIGSVIDVTKGTIDLTTTATDTTTQTARFYSGVFKLTQPKSSNPVTELQLFGSNFKKACGTTGRRASASATKKKVVRQLWGSGSGKFRTKGRYGSASIRGTQWLTQDRCDGTLVRVAQGSVTVRDLVKKKNVIVNAPKSYLAKAPVKRRG